MVVLRNKNGYLEDKKLYGITPRRGRLNYWSGVLNSTLCRFFMDLLCRQLTGAQAIADIDVQVVEEILIPKEGELNIEKLLNRYDRIKQRPIEMHVRDEYSCTDRYELDEVIFDALNLNQKEREAVYEAVIDLVESRLKKAESLKV